MQRNSQRKYDSGKTQNKRAKCVTTGEVIRLGSCTMYAATTTTTAEKEEAKGGGKGKLYNSSTLEWGSLVRDDTAGILKSGLLVGYFAYSMLIVRARDGASRDCISVLNAFALSRCREPFAWVNEEDAPASWCIIQKFCRLIWWTVLRRALILVLFLLGGIKNIFSKKIISNSFKNGK